jgi:hypothetical protein
MDSMSSPGTALALSDIGGRAVSEGGLEPLAYILGWSPELWLSV